MDGDYCDENEDDSLEDKIYGDENLPLLVKMILRKIRLPVPVMVTIIEVNKNILMI